MSPKLVVCATLFHNWKKHTHRNCNMKLTPLTTTPQKLLSKTFENLSWHEKPKRQIPVQSRILRDLKFVLWITRHKGRIDMMRLVLQFIHTSCANLESGLSRVAVQECNYFICEKLTCTRRDKTRIQIQ